MIHWLREPDLELARRRDEPDVALERAGDQREREQQVVDVELPRTPRILPAGERAHALDRIDLRRELAREALRDIERPFERVLERVEQQRPVEVIRWRDHAASFAANRPRSRFAASAVGSCPRSSSHANSSAGVRPAAMSRASAASCGSSTDWIEMKCA